MQRHDQRANLQARACSVLASVASGDAECRRAVVGGFGVVAICEAMHVHKGTLEVEQPACTTLNRLSRSDAPEEADDIASMCVRSIIGSDGLQRLVSALRWHPTSGSLTQTIASTIANIAAAVDEEARPQIIAAHAIPPLLNALSRHAKKAHVAEHGLAALSNVMFGGAQYVDVVVRYGGMHFISDAMTHHRRRESLLLSLIHI